MGAEKSKEKFQKIKNFEGRKAFVGFVAVFAECWLKWCQFKAENENSEGSRKGAGVERHYGFDQSSGLERLWQSL